MQEPASLTAFEMQIAQGEEQVIKINAYYTEIKVLIEHTSVLWAKTLFLRDSILETISEFRKLNKDIKSCAKELQTQSEHLSQQLARKISEASTLPSNYLPPHFLTNTPAFEIDELKTLCLVNSDQQSRINRLIQSLPTLPQAIEQQTPQTLVKLSNKCGSEALKSAELLNSMCDSSDKDLTPFLTKLTKIQEFFKKIHKEQMNTTEYLSRCYSEFLEVRNAPLNLFPKFEQDIERVDDRENQYNLLASKVHEFSNIVDQATEKHAKVQQSINKWTQEQSRRQQSAKQLTELVNSATKALENQYNTEQSLRNQFLNENHEFLPPNLLKLAVEMPVKYTINRSPP